MTTAPPAGVDPALYPFTPRRLDLGDTWMSYVDEGSGPTVVMLHGNPSWSFYYRRLAADLRRDHRVVVPDHVGMGLSDKPSPADYPHTLPRRVADFTALMEAVAPDGPVTLVVHDWGGLIGLAWAVEHPEQVARLVVLNTAAFPLPPGRGLPALIRLARLPLVSEPLIRGANAFAVGTALLGTRRPLRGAVRRGYLAPYRDWRSRAAVHRFVQDIPLSPADPGHALLTRTAARLDVLRDRPVLVCWGERDPVFGRWCLDTWREVYPQAEVHRFDAGHYVLEDEADTVVPLVRRFVHGS